MFPTEWNSPGSRAVNYPALKGEASTLRGFPEETLQRFSF